MLIELKLDRRRDINFKSKAKIENKNERYIAWKGAKKVEDMIPILLAQETRKHFGFFQMG